MGDEWLNCVLGGFAACGCNMATHAALTGCTGSSQCSQHFLWIQYKQQLAALARATEQESDGVSEFASGIAWKSAQKRINP